jgi:hypothetical protein
LTASAFGYGSRWNVQEIGGKVWRMLMFGAVGHLSGNATTRTWCSSIPIESISLRHGWTLPAALLKDALRASNARYIDADGSGLGLAIAQWIAAAHHGKLEALSLSGNGTTFRLTLPLQFGSSAGRNTAA